MEQIIIDMIEQASETSNYQLIGYVSNLRPCTPMGNGKNRKINRNNTSGYKGLHGIKLIING